MGRRPGINDSERELRLQFARALWSAIGTRRGSQSKAAARLGVSRQSLHLYLHQKATPGGSVLRRACELWNLSLELPGLTVNSTSFVGGARLRTIHRQMSLLDVIAATPHEHLRVEILKKTPHSVDLRISIDFPERVQPKSASPVRPVKRRSRAG
jgi:transcriptional regulator with XRE-family HTH domain